MGMKILKPLSSSLSSLANRAISAPTSFVTAVSSLIILCLATFISSGFAQPDSTINPPLAATSTPSGYKIAIVAGGCFWCVESDFEKLPGVITAESGYTGGHTQNPTYKQVSYTETGHYEAVKITYDPNQVSYRELLDHFWVNIDPFDDRGQFCDKGSSYLSAIFPIDAEQRKLAQQSYNSYLALFPDKVSFATQIIDASTFYPAEDYHQDYYKNNPLRYKYYRYNCGRDARLETIWGDKAGGKTASKNN